MNDKFTLSQNDYEDAANFLDIELPALQAVAKIESFGSGFTDSHKPTILIILSILIFFTSYTSRSFTAPAA